MPKSRALYPIEFRRQMVELARAGRDPNDLAREFEPSARAIRKWVAEADRSEGRHEAKPPPADPGQVQTGIKGKRTAYLIAVRPKHDALRIYAVIAPSTEAALAQLDGLTTDGMKIEVVGALSRDLIRHLGLKAGELRLV